MLELYKRYYTERKNENGVVVDYDFHYPENFNFAYDVVDEIAAAEPDRVHIIDSNRTIEEIFEDVKRDLSDIIG